MNRETIITALFALVSGAAPFETASRRLKLWGSVPPSEKPALFLVERGDNYVRGSEAVPEAVTMQLEIYLYTCGRLGCHPDEALFLDDKKINVDGAKRAGMQAYVFHSASDTVMQTGEQEITVGELRARLLGGR